MDIHIVKSDIQIYKPISQTSLKVCISMPGYLLERFNEYVSTKINDFKVEALIE